MSNYLGKKSALGYAMADKLVRVWRMSDEDGKGWRKTQLRAMLKECSYVSHLQFCFRDDLNSSRW